LHVGILSSDAEIGCHMLDFYQSQCRFTWISSTSPSTHSAGFHIIHSLAPVSSVINTSSFQLTTIMGKEWHR